MTCIHCNGEHPDGSKFCPVTGREIMQSFKSCTNPECDLYGRNELPFEAKYCPKCGRIIGLTDRMRNNDKVVSRTSYALGMSIAQNMRNSGITSVNIDDFLVGAKAIFAGAGPAISFQDAAEILDKYFAKLKA